jgi:hypothetical protein
VKVIKRIALYAGAACVILTLGLYIYLAAANDPGHFWRAASHMQVTIDGRAIPEARVYRKPNGMLLMSLGGKYGWQLYRPNSKSVYLCNPIKTIPIPAYIYAKDCDSRFCPCVRLGDVKTEVDAQLNVQPNFIEFNSRERERIRVSW